jgi:hypothetical protein
MIADRYTKVVLTIIAAALVMITVRSWLPEFALLTSIRPQPAHAQTESAKYEVAVPKAWGKLVAYSNNNLLLEAQDHSLRVVDVDGKAPEYPKVKVLIRWQ